MAAMLSRRVIAAMAAPTGAAFPARPGRRLKPIGERWQGPHRPGLVNCGLSRPGFLPP